MNKLLLFSVFSILTLNVMAQAKAREMVEQSEVMQTAYAQANETVNNANQHRAANRTS